MSEKNFPELRKKIKKMADEAIKENNPTGWFERFYQSSNGDPNQIPWAKLAPHSCLEMWLEEKQISGQGQKALVIGCGLGDDAEILAQVGFRVSAFDISPSAIAWCESRFPNSTVQYQVADLLAENESWRKQFDFVFECQTIQALPLNMRSQVIEKIAQFVADQGKLLIVTRIRDSETPPEGPPWALSHRELNEFQQQGLTLIETQEFITETAPEVTSLRLEFQRIYIS